MVSALGQLASAYVAGLLTVFTPCIYPIIPVTLSLFGVTAELPRRKAFVLACCYTAGICLTYTMIGLVSARAKILFGSTLGNIWMASALAIFFALLALYSIEIIKFSGIGKLQNAFSKIGGKGRSGAFLMGAASGFVAAPCAGPILAGILALAAQSGNAPWSALLLFTYALGFGTLFIALGTFANLTKKLPRPGAWMNAIKFLTAAALLAVSLSLLRPFASSFFPPASSVLAPLATLAFALVLARVAYLRDYSALKIGTVLVAALSLIDLVSGASPPSSGEVRWLTSIAEATSAARRSNMIAMVDFFAEWCAACQELSHQTFPEPRVAQKLGEFAVAKIDFTTIDDDKQAILDKYGLVGLPAILFLAPNGEEIPDSRVTGFMTPDEFLAHLSRIQQHWSHPPPPPIE